MRFIRRIALGTLISFLIVAGVSDVAPAGLGALLLACVVLGWLEWRAWRRPAPTTVTPSAEREPSH